MLFNKCIKIKVTRPKHFGEMDAVYHKYLDCYFGNK